MFIYCIANRKIPHTGEVCQLAPFWNTNSTATFAAAVELPPEAAAVAAVVAVAAAAAAVVGGGYGGRVEFRWQYLLPRLNMADMQREVQHRGR